MWNLWIVRETLKDTVLHFDKDISKYHLLHFIIFWSGYDLHYAHELWGGNCVRIPRQMMQECQPKQFPFWHPIHHGPWYHDEWISVVSISATVETLTICLITLRPIYTCDECARVITIIYKPNPHRDQGMNKYWHYHCGMWLFTF